MKVFCPKCSTIAHPINYARGPATLAGIVAGGGGVIAHIVNGIRSGARFGPVGAALGSVLTVLFAASTGGISGSQVGRLIDENVIGHWHCSKCGHKFKA